MIFQENYKEFSFEFFVFSNWTKMKIFLIWFCNRCHSFRKLHLFIIKTYIFAQTFCQYIDEKHNFAFTSILKYQNVDKWTRFLLKTQLNSYWNISRNIDFIDENFGKWRFKDKATLTFFAFEIMPNLLAQDMKLLDFVF